MMKPDCDDDDTNRYVTKDQSSSPSRRFHQYQRKNAIEATSQMHSLDYNDNNDEYYNITDVVSSATPNGGHLLHKQNPRMVRSRQEQAIVNDTVSLTATTTPNNGKDIASSSSSNSSSRSSGWFSLPWTNTTTGSQTVVHDHKKQRSDHAMAAIIEEPNLHDPIGTKNHTDNNGENDIIPSSPKRRTRNFKMLMESPVTPPQSSYHQVKMESNSKPNDDTAGSLTEMEYSSLHEQTPHLPQHEISATADPHADCSYFFRPDDCAYDNNNNNNQRKSKQQHEWKTIRRDHYKRHNSGQSIMYEYSDAVAVTPMPILQQYRTKFAQLNSELITERGSRRHRQEHQYPQSRQIRYFDYDYDDDDHHHVVLEQQRDPFDDWYMQQSSLQLQEYDVSATATTSANGNGEFIPESLPYYNANSTLPQTRRQHPSAGNHHGIVRSDTVRQSSLFFMADGRMLMRLPRDRVRLLVDPDLEVGVLSVEQWRVATTTIENDNETTADRLGQDVDETSHHVTDHDTSQNSIPRMDTRTEDNGSSPIPELRYVLTVSDDLYRKIVEEMSPTSIKYFCCTRGCCNDEEKVDIRIAFVLFGMILLILFINMLAFREH